jgi:hypothetical protein
MRPGCFALDSASKACLTGGNRSRYHRAYCKGVVGKSVGNPSAHLLAINDINGLAAKVWRTAFPRNLVEE